jgi:hypothetical protein
MVTGGENLHFSQPQRKDRALFPAPHPRPSSPPLHRAFQLRAQLFFLLGVYSTMHPSR